METQPNGIEGCVCKIWRNFEKISLKIGNSELKKNNHTVFKISTDLFQVRHGSSLQKIKKSAKRHFFQEQKSK